MTRTRRPLANRLCGRALLGAALLLALPLPGNAEQAYFAIAPSDNTSRALNEAPTRSRQGDEGLQAALGVAWSHHSNVRRDSVESAEGEQSDSAYVFSPELGYKRRIGRHSAEIGLASRFTRFEELSEEDSEDYTLHGLASLDFTRILNLDLYGSFTDAAEPRGGSGTRLVQDPVPDQVETSRYGGLFTIGRRVARLQIGIGADRTQRRYQNNGQQFRDRDEDRLRARIYYNVSPRTSLFTGVSMTDIKFHEPDLDADSDELTYEAGARWEVSAKTTGRISVGWTEKDFADPLREDPGESTLAGKLNWTPTTRTTFSVYGARQFEESTSREDGYLISELLGISVNQLLGSRFSAYAYFNRSNDDFQSNRQDDITDYGAGIDYSLRRWLSLGLRYSLVERSSNAVGHDFEDEMIGLYLNSTFDFGNR